MFKKVIKIILILLAIFLLILGIIWLIDRHKAKEASKTPPSFKQFLGLGTKESSAPTIAGQYASSFGNGSGGGNGNSGNLGNGNDNNGKYSNTTNTSQFTNSGTSPTGNFGLGGGGNGNGGATGNNNNTSTIGLGDNSGDTGTTAPVCSTADTTITFTAVEIAELNTLQNRFYSLAQTLHTDSDVATEVANHDAFALKADQATELYNYCESKLPLITDPRLQQHLSTPFWRQWLATDTPANIWNTSGKPDKDIWSFIDFSSTSTIDAAHLTDIHDNNPDNPDTSGLSGPFGLLNISNPGQVNISGSSLGTDTQLLVPVVERILRINLW